MGNENFTGRGQLWGVAVRSRRWKMWSKGIQLLSGSTDWQQFRSWSSYSKPHNRQEFCRLVTLLTSGWYAAAYFEPYRAPPPHSITIIPNKQEVRTVHWMYLLLLLFYYFQKASLRRHVEIDPWFFLFLSLERIILVTSYNQGLTFKLDTDVIHF